MTHSGRIIIIGCVSFVARVCMKNRFSCRGCWLQQTLKDVSTLLYTQDQATAPVGVKPSHVKNLFESAPCGLKISAQHDSTTDGGVTMWRQLTLGAVHPREWHLFSVPCLGTCNCVTFFQDTKNKSIASHFGDHVLRHHIQPCLCVDFAPCQTGHCVPRPTKDFDMCPHYAAYCSLVSSLTQRKNDKHQHGKEQLNSRIRLIHSNSSLSVQCTRTASRSIPCPSLVTKRESIRHREVTRVTSQQKNT